MLIIIFAGVLGAVPMRAVASIEPFRIVPLSLNALLIIAQIYIGIIYVSQLTEFQLFCQVKRNLEFNRLHDTNFASANTESLKKN